MDLRRGVGLLSSALGLAQAFLFTFLANAKSKSPAG